MALEIKLFEITSKDGSKEWVIATGMKDATKDSANKIEELPLKVSMAALEKMGEFFGPKQP